MTFTSPTSGLAQYRPSTAPRTLLRRPSGSQVIRIPPKPRGQPVTNTIYVVDSNNVAVINGATNRVTGRIGAAYAVDAAVDSSRNMVYTVTLDEMLVINGATKISHLHRHQSDRSLECRGGFVDK